MNIQSLKKASQGYIWEIERALNHEIGHALGLDHEHKNPNKDFTWIEDAVYGYCKRILNWDENRCAHNFFETTDRSDLYYTDFDEKSVMLYTIMGHHNEQGYSIREVQPRPSANDILTLKKFYPFTGDAVRTRNITEALDKRLFSDVLYHFESTFDSYTPLTHLLYAKPDPVQHENRPDITVQALNLFLVNDKELAHGFGRSGIKKSTLMTVIFNFHEHEDYAEIVKTVAKYVTDWTKVGHPEHGWPLRTIMSNERFWNKEAATAMLEAGANVDSNYNNNPSQDWNHTPLMAAAISKNAEAFELLLKYCPKTDYRVDSSNNRRTPPAYVSLKRWIKSNSSKEIYKMFKKAGNYCNN